MDEIKNELEFKTQLFRVTKFMTSKGSSEMSMEVNNQVKVILRVETINQKKDNN